MWNGILGIFLYIVLVVSFSSNLYQSKTLRKFIRCRKRNWRDNRSRGWWRKIEEAKKAAGLFCSRKDSEYPYKVYLKQDIWVIWLKYISFRCDSNFSFEKKLRLNYQRRQKSYMLQISQMCCKVESVCHLRSYLQCIMFQGCRSGKRSHLHRFRFVFWVVRYRGHLNYRYSVILWRHGTLFIFHLYVGIYMYICDFFLRILFLSR